MKFNINNNKIGHNCPTYFIADIAANHDGDLIRAKELIYMASEAGANAAKFQHFDAETIVSDYGFKNLISKQSHQAKWNKSVFETYKSASVSMNWNIELVETCQKANIDFFTSPYSIEIVDEINSFVPAYKIGSGDITWDEIVMHIAKKNKPYILATGASNLEDVKKTVDKCLKINKKFALLQCNTNYTAELENFKYINLNVLKKYAELFPGIILGLSDHTPGHTTVLGAITLGAKIIEKHFTDNNNRIGPDHLFSMNPNSWIEMVERSRELEYSLGDGIKKIEDNEKETVVIQRRSIRVKNALKVGHIIKYGDLECLRPCPSDGISPSEINNIIGKTVIKDLPKGCHITKNDMDE